MITFFWNYIIPVTVVGGIAASIFLVTQAVLRRAQLRLRVSTVLLVAALFLLPLPQAARLLPQIEIPVLRSQYVRIEPISQIITAPIVPEVQTAFTAQNHATTPSNVLPQLPPQAGKGLSLYEILPLVWLAGALAVAAASLIQYVKFVHLLRTHSTNIPMDRTKMLWRQVSCETKETVSLRVTDVFSSPVSLGTLRPCVYLPVAMLKNKELEYALLHESIHLREHHVWYKILLQMVCVLQWFNPLVWAVQVEISKACEYACDERVTARMNAAQRHAYGTLLLDCAAARRTPATVNAFGGAAKQIYQRLQAVLTPPKRGAKQRVMAVAVVALTLSAGMLTACAANSAAQGLAVDSGAQSAPPPASVQTADSAIPTEAMPNVKGKKEAEAKEALEAAGYFCNVKYVQVKGDAQANYEDYVLSATPDTQSAVPKSYHGVVNLWVVNQKAFTEATGENSDLVMYTLQDLTGLTKEEAVKRLTELDISYEIKFVKDTPEIPEGVVAGSAPQAGGLVQPSSQRVLEDYLGPVEIFVAQKNAEDSFAPENAASVQSNSAKIVDGMAFPVSDYSYITLNYKSGGHRGTDIVAESGTPIYSVLAGTVTEAKNDWSLGNYVTVESENGVTLLYAHCATLAVEKGDLVEMGQQIATVGSTGNSTGVHLHLEYNMNGTLHDPAELFPELKDTSGQTG